MRKAFTLIELLIVLTIITLVMGVVVPKGVKMLSSYEHAIERSQEIQKLSQAQGEAFLLAKEIEIKLLDKHYKITKKGMLIEKSDVNR